MNHAMTLKQRQMKAGLGKNKRAVSAIFANNNNNVENYGYFAMADFI